MVLSIRFNAEAVRRYVDRVDSNLPDMKLLHNVSTTIDSLCYLQREFEELAVLLNAMDISGDKILDPTNELAEVFEFTEQKLKDFLSIYSSKRDSAKNAPELNGDHEENVLMEYNRVLDRVKRLICVFQDKRWEIMEHDADFDEVIGPFYTAEEFLADLKA